MAGLPPGTPRFFARIDRFQCECPRCGMVIRAHFDRSAGKVRRDLIAKGPGAAHRRGEEQRRIMIYNPLTSRLTCPECGRVFGVGLLLYPVAPKCAPAQPSDQKPTWQQLLALRQLAGGFFMDKAYPIKRDQPMNISVDEPCVCYVDTETPPRAHYVPHCPIHGWTDRPGAEIVIEHATEIPPATDPDPEDE